MDDKVKGAVIGGLAALATGNPAAFLKPLYDAYTFVAGDAVAERLRAEMDGLVTAVAELEGCHREEAANRLVDLMARCRPEVRDLVYDTHRTIFFAKSKAAWPYVLRLTADRIKNHEGVPDSFSKRAAWLLERCEEQDLRVLREALFKTNERLVRRGNPRSLDVSWHAVEQGGISLQEGLGDAVWCSDDGGPSRDSTVSARAYELIELLVDSRLASSRNTTKAFFTSDEGGNLRRMIELFR